MKGSSERLSFWGRAEKKVLSVSKRQHATRLRSLSDLTLLTKQRRYHRSQHLQPNRLSSSRQKRLGLVRRSCLQKIMRPFVHKSMKR